MLARVTEFAFEQAAPLGSVEVKPVGYWVVGLVAAAVAAAEDG